MANERSPLRRTVRGTPSTGTARHVERLRPRHVGGAATRYATDLARFATSALAASPLPPPRGAAVTARRDDEEARVTTRQWSRRTWRTTYRLRRCSIQASRGTNQASRRQAGG
jgi:hypothetical protein